MSVYPLPYDRRQRELARLLRPPQSWEEWRDAYNRREDYYNGDAYTDEEIRAWHLFEARTDTTDEVIARTRQLTRDYQHVVDVGGSALAAGATLQDGPVNDHGLTREGLDIWRRAGLLGGLTDPAKMLTKLGRFGVEAVLDEDGAPTLLIHEPQHYRVSYGRTNRHDITQVVITIPYFDDIEVSATGEVTEGVTLHTYVRRLTPERVDTWVDGELVSAQSGKHGLGVVPFTNHTFNRAGLSEHGWHAAHALAPAIAHYDAAFSQMRAIFNRMGNPHMVMTGGVLADDSAQKFGRIVNIKNPSGDLKYVEMTAQGIAVLLKGANDARLAARETLPEFLFAGAGAGASGEALRWRATAFERKYSGVREQLFGGLARITQIAHHYGENTAYTPEAPFFEVTGAPLLPPDVQAELAALESTTRVLPLQPRDIVKTYQRLGLVSADEDPDTYAAEAGDQSADAARRFFQHQQAP